MWPTLCWVFYMLRLISSSPQSNREDGSFPLLFIRGDQVWERLCSSLRALSRTLVELKAEWCSPVSLMLSTVCALSRGSLSIHSSPYRSGSPVWLGLLLLFFFDSGYCCVLTEQFYVFEKSHHIRSTEVLLKCRFSFFLDKRTCAEFGRWRHTHVERRPHSESSWNRWERVCVVPAGAPACMATLADYTWITHHKVKATLGALNTAW